MSQEELVSEIYERLVTKLENDLNSEISILIDVSDVKNKILNSLNTDDSDNVFDIVYNQVYATALQNLTNDIFSSEIFTTTENDCASSSSTLGNNNFKSLAMKSEEITDPCVSTSSSVFEASLRDNGIGVVPQHVEDDAKTLCSLLPNLEKDKIVSKLQKNSNNYSKYKAKLLQKCITKTLEKGLDVSELVFLKMEEWLSESQDTHPIKVEETRLRSEANDVLHTNLNQNNDIACLPTHTEYQNNSGAYIDSKHSSSKTADLVPSFDLSQFNERINFISEIRPDLSKEVIVDKVKQCACEKDAQTVLSTYLNYFDFTSENGNNKACSTSDSECCRKSETQGQTSHCNTPQSHNNIDETERDGESDKGCMIIDVVQKRKPIPVLISLDEDAASPASNGSDIFFVEEVKTPPKETSMKASSSKTGCDNQENTIVSTMPVPINISDDDSHNVERECEREVENMQDVHEPEGEALMDIENDDVPWQEAHEICNLLPFLSLNSIHQSLMDNYYHPQRKVNVLREYVELSFEEGHDISMDVFETILMWQRERKRHSSTSEQDISNANCKRLKQGNHSRDEEGIQPVASTSKAGIDIPANQVMSVVEAPDSYNADEMNAVEKLFNSYPPEQKSWYQKKVDFLMEVNNSLSKQYILSQIIHCQNDADILNVAGRLLEEQTTNLASNNVAGRSETLPNHSGVEDHSDATVQGMVVDEATSSEATEEDSNSNSASAADVEDRIQAHVTQLGEIFPDADPDYLGERANELAGDNQRFQEMVVEMTDKREYPKMEEYLARQKRLNMRKKFIEGMSVEEFMGYFEDPEKVFNDTSTEMNQLYIKNARAQLMKDFPYHLSKVIDSVFRSSNHHYLPTLRVLKTSKGARKTRRSVGGPLPGDMDDVFIKEFCYAKMEHEIKDHHTQKETEKKLAFQKAKEEGRLLECQCCYDDEVLMEDTSTCDSGAVPHYFCNTCIKRYAEEQIGQGKMEFLCLEGECKSPFPLGTLKKLLRPSVFSNLLKRKQAEEIAAASIEDLESCPFCNFATIMPNQEDRVFKCLNPECLKDSCRLCKELNHIPLRCEEVEKKKQTDARTFLENEMSEAIVRECYKCKRRFIKEEGCNKMVCSCGAMMCYLCKQPIKGYDHFSQDSRSTVKSKSDKCPLWSNSLQLHAEEVEKGAKEAKQKLEPGVDLLHDPTKDLPQVPEYLKKRPPTTHWPHFPPNPIAGNLGVGRRPHHYINELNNQLDVGVGDFLEAEMMHYVQRHSHQHRHHHFFFPLQNHLPPPPQLVGHLPPAGPPPAHLPPPPPAHQPRNYHPFPFYDPRLHAQLPPQFPIPLRAPQQHQRPPHPPRPANAFNPHHRREEPLNPAPRQFNLLNPPRNSTP